MGIRRIVTVLSLVVSLAQAGQTGPAPVPAEYADLYATLGAQLRTIDRYVSSHAPAARHDVLFSTELLPANANAGESLLREQAWQAVVVNLDRFQLLGVRAVKVAIKYPVLIPGFPRSAEYLDFYKRVGQELRRRNIKMLAQMTNGFREPVFSSLPVEGHYAGLTWERFKREKRLQAEMIILTGLRGRSPNGETQIS